MAESTKERRVFRLGNLYLNLDSYRLTVEGRPVELTLQEMDLLGILIQNAERVVKYADLTQQMWGDEGHLLNRNLNVLVHRLRSKLVGSAPFQIETVRGRGYGLLRAVEGSGIEKDAQRPFPRAGPRASVKQSGSPR